MVDHFLIFNLSLAIAGFISFFLGYYIWRKERTNRQKLFSSTMFLTSFWCFTYILQIGSTSVSYGLFWENIKFISIILVPVTFFLFALIYAEKEQEINLKLYLSLFIIPLLHIGIIFTNDIHHLFWISQTAVSTESGLLIDSVYGPLFWFHTFYSYVLLLCGFLFILKTFFQSHYLYSKQAIFLIAGLLAPIIGNILTIFNIITFSYDLTPLLFVFTGAFFSLSIFQYRLFSIMPIAREKIIEQLSEAIFVLDTDQNIIDFNQSARKMIEQGYISINNNGVIGSSASELFKDIINPKILSNHMFQTIKEINLAGDNKEKFFEIELSPIIGKKHHSIGQTIIIKDVTKNTLKNKNEKLRLSKIQQQQQAITSLSKNKYLLTGKKQKAFSLITETAAKQIGVERVSIWLLQHDKTEMRCIDLYNSGSNTHTSGNVLKAQNYPQYFKSLNEGRAIDASDACTDPRTSEFCDNYLRPLHIVSMLDAPIWVSGKLVGVICFEQLHHLRKWQDYELTFAGEVADQITQVILNAEQKKAEVALRLLNKDLEQRVKQRTNEIEKLLKQKDEFIHQLGHDLKNPLGPLVSLLPILEKRLSNEADKEIVKVMMRNVSYMKNLVTKTLELAKLSSPNTKIHIESFELSDELQLILEKNTFLFAEKNMTVNNTVVDPILLNADKLLFEELFTNLINNAVKYSDDNGNISIYAEEKDDEIIISVKDNGVGMTPDQMERLFDEFYKADESRHDFDSSGLGMPICRRIVEKHRGRIWIESEGLGKGSTFYFSLPKAIEND